MTPLETQALGELKGSFRRVSYDPADATPDVVHHYTTAEGLFGIVSKGILWGTNFAYMNDEKEILYGRDLVRELLATRLTTEQRNTPLYLTLTALDDALSGVGEKLDLYVTCFCAEPDLLGLWRAYGPEGGYSIGFRFGERPSVAVPHFWTKVLYDPATQRAKVEAVIASAEEAIRKGQSEDPHFLAEVATAVGTRLVTRLSSFKAKAFAEEREWRTVHMFEESDRVEFARPYGALRPYVELWGSSERAASDHLPIEEVHVGPPATPQRIRAAELLLRRFGYSDVRVLPSSIPVVLAGGRR
jgi:hypothetical protein